MLNVYDYVVDKSKLIQPTSERVASRAPLFVVEDAISEWYSTVSDDHNLQIYDYKMFGAGNWVWYITDGNDRKGFMASTPDSSVIFKLMDEQVIATAKCRQVPVLEDNGEVDMYRYLDQADVLSGINKLVAKIREMES